MTLIKRITDKDILGTEGLSNAKPRYTARAILKNRDDQYAVMYAGAFHLYSLPGGGIEQDESVIEALKREIQEETGCTCDIMEPLGFIEENRAHQDYVTVSHYFVVTTNCQTLTPTLTEDEQKNGTSVSWFTLDEAYHAIADIDHPTTQRKFLQSRDLAALNAYINNI